MIILSHRGLELPPKITESSLESIIFHFQHNQGIELDLNFSQDQKLFFFHDKDLSRITNNQDNRQFKNLKISEINQYTIQKNHFCDFKTLIKLIKKFNPPLVALHFKGGLQNQNNTQIIINQLKKNYEIIDKLLIFDLKVKTAKEFKKQLPQLNLALSIAHSYDIQRFNKFTNNTLYSIKNLIKNKNLFTWAWLDEWDRTNINNSQKSLYNEKIFKILRENFIKIALVTPELHSTSPSLCANEKHQDNSTIKKYQKRLKQIIKLKPDAICTDNTDLFI